MLAYMDHITRHAMEIANPVTGSCWLVPAFQGVPLACSCSLQHTDLIPECVLNPDACHFQVLHTSHANAEVVFDFPGWSAPQWICCVVNLPATNKATDSVAAAMAQSISA